MIKRKIVLEFLRLKQETEGGFTGTDLTDLAEILGVTPRGLRWRISNWIKSDNEFSQFIYLGKEKPPITLFEFFKINHELRENPIKVKKGLYEDIQEERKAENQKPLAESTFYRHVKQEVLSIYCSETKKGQFTGPSVGDLHIVFRKNNIVVIINAKPDINVETLFELATKQDAKISRILEMIK